MKAKTFIILGIVAVVLFAVYQAYKNGSLTVTKTTDPGSDSKGLPSISDLMAKGYDLEEANSILKSLEAGSDINY